MPGCSSIFWSLCRGPAPLPEDEPKLVESKHNRKPFRTCLIDAEPKSTSQTENKQAHDVLALLQLQRELGAIHGTWLSRARDIMTTVASAFDAAEAQLYGAVRADKDGPPTSFVLLLSTSNNAWPATPDAGPSSHILPGQEVWPEPSGESDSIHPERLHRLVPPLPCERAGSPHRQQLLNLLPHMLDRLIVSQAPVVRCAPTWSRRPTGQSHTAGSSKSDSKERPPAGNISVDLCNSSTFNTAEPTAHTTSMAALIPLLAGDRLYGALWIAVCRSPNAPPPARASQSLIPPTPSPGASLRPASASTRPSTSLRLQDSVVLQQLSLSLSLCLLGSELPYMVTLSECLHQISAATCMQALLSGLCDGMAQVVRLRFLLEARVIPALVPEPTSPVGLMISWAATDRVPAGASALSRTNTKASRCLVPTPQQSVLSLGIGDVRSEGIDGSVGMHHQHTPRLLAGPVATLVGKEAHVLCRAHSATNPPSVGRPQTAATGLDGSIGAGAGGLRPIRPGSVQRVIPLSNTDLLGTSPSEIGPGMAAVHMAVTAAVLASGAASAPALRVKPFPMAHTLLRHLIRKPGGRASTMQATAGTGNGAAAGAHGTRLGACNTGMALAPPSPPARAYGMEVKDCTSHVQDAKRPSRDLLLLLANMSMGLSTSIAVPMLPDRAAAVAAADGGGGSVADTVSSLMASSSAPVVPALSGGSFSSGRRAVGSLLLLALPTDEGKGVLGMYVTFAQRLPVQLLSEARSNLVDLLEVAGPLITYKLRNELSLELGTLSAAAPGSYVVVEGPEMEAPSHNAAVTVNTARRTHDLTCIASESRLSNPPTTVNPDEQTATQQAREGLVPFYNSLAPYTLCDPRQLAGQGSCTLAMGTVGGAEGSLAHINSMNLMDTLMGCGPEPGGAMTCLLSGRYSVAAHSTNQGLNMGQDVYSTSVIHVEELDTVNNSMRAQMPLLVASMQSSISNVRVEATVAAMAAASSLRPNATMAGTITSLLPGSPEIGDLAQLELHSQLGHGGCAVVFKGSLGIWDCAVKLMEMPEVDNVDGLQGPTSIKTGDTGRVGEGDAPHLAEGAGGDGDGGGGDDDENVDQHVAARRALLRNAMELAAMTSISHPNIMQVYSTFSNVTLGRRTMPDRSERFILKPVDGFNNKPDGPPVCVAIVCEWCDKGCLGSGLYKRTFPTLITPSAPSSGSSCSRHNTPTARFGARMVDYRGIYMTLLDVAMALRHLHTHHLIHRDLKPANVLLKTNSMDPRGFTAKLADFGFVTLLNQQGDDLNGGEAFAVVDETCGTVTHMPPESWKKPARVDASYDVYSFGILMWELTAGGVRPYPDVHPKNIPLMVRRGVRPTFDDTVPSQYRILAQRCWSTDPNHRPRTSEVVRVISQLLGRM